MLHLICNIIKNFNSYRREPYDKSVHTGEEPYLYDFIIVYIWIRDMCVIVCFFQVKKDSYYMFLFNKGVTYESFESNESIIVLRPARNPD